MKFHVCADETRPLLQGSRITAYELQQNGIPVTVICDGMAATVMSQGKVQAVIVGTDRVAANGDVANKIGTLGVAILARHYRIPFYVAAPTSSIDLSLADGSPHPHRAARPRGSLPRPGPADRPRRRRHLQPRLRRHARRPGDRHHHREGRRRAALRGIAPYGREGRDARTLSEQGLRAVSASIVWARQLVVLRLVLLPRHRRLGAGWGPAATSSWPWPPRPPTSPA